MFPYAHYDIPIFGLDMVGFGGNITLAIADLHPASMSRMLPPIYSQASLSFRFDAAVALGKVQRMGGDTKLRSCAMPPCLASACCRPWRW